MKIGDSVRVICIKFLNTLVLVFLIVCKERNSVLLDQILFNLNYPAESCVETEINLATGPSIYLLVYESRGNVALKLKPSLPLQWISKTNWSTCLFTISSNKLPQVVSLGQQGIQRNWCSCCYNCDVVELPFVHHAIQGYHTHISSYLLSVIYF